MLRAMNFLGAGIPVGTWFGIRVRLHFTFFIFGYLQAASFASPPFGVWFGVAWVVGLYVCILLHEFGHALAAKWCDGEASDILLWPLGGLAFVRPAFHPTAHLITTVAGPFVTLVLWVLFWGCSEILVRVIPPNSSNLSLYLIAFVKAMEGLNRWLLLFNMLPCFPMDGGRILRDTLWYFVGAEKATRFAIRVSHFVALVAIGWVIGNQLGMEGIPQLEASPLMILVLAFFIFSQTAGEAQYIAHEARGQYGFSISERLKRGVRGRAFRRAVTERQKSAATVGFHRCHTCGRSENDGADLEFRTCSECADGQEYCQEHLRNHRHVKPARSER